MRECCKHGQAEVVSNSSNKMSQTWGPPFSQSLYYISCSLTALSCTRAMGQRSSAVPLTMTLTLVSVAPNSGAPFQWSSGMNGV